MRYAALNRVRLKRNLAPLPCLRSSIVCPFSMGPWTSRGLRPSVTVFMECQRGAKTKTRTKLKDLPQGGIDVKPLPRDEGRPTYPTVVRQARSNMTKFQNCVLLTRVGSFYELYFEHAEEFGPLLNLKVAQKKTNAGPVSMAGFPFFQLDRFLKTLVQDLNRYVAISEEFPNDVSAKVKSGGLMFDRKVTRVITPGTLIDERFMDPYENNFLLGIYLEDKASFGDLGNGQGQSSGATFAGDAPVGLAWLDLSTGDFFTQSATLISLPSAIARIGPREIVLDEDLQTSQEHGVFLMLQEERHLITYHPSPRNVSPVSSWSSMLENPVAESLQAQFTLEEIAAGSLLLDYVKVRLQGLKMKLQPPIRRLAVDNMGIDKNSMRALEIKATLRDGVSKGSLFHAIRKTVTKSGARLLSNWLTSPSTSLSVINGRLDLVSRFLKDQILREKVVQLLRRSYDSQRLVQKFSLGRGDPDDLIALCRTVEATQGIFGVLNDLLLLEGAVSLDVNAPERRSDVSTRAASVVSLLQRLNLDGPTALAAQVAKSVDEEGLIQKQRIEESEAANVVATAREIIGADLSEEESVSFLGKGESKGGVRSNNGRDGVWDYADVWVMRKDASSTLSNLHERLDALDLEKADLAEKLRDQLGATSLTLRWTPGLGHICHVKGKDIKSSLSSLDNARSVSSSKSTKSFHLLEWTHLGSRIDQTKLRIRAEEQRIFHTLCEQVILNLVKLRRNAIVLDELDVVCSFAALAEEKNFVRPILNLGSSHKIVGGRHPTVEVGLREQGRSFISNDCFIGEQERVWLITGPNMAGKSTFLRQNALISILAQIGSYVPVEYAEIGIVDQILSRVGSADDLSRDQSTFMVEMLEAAEILKQATPRSFVIMDEVGRGTTPEDGIAVGYACLHHLYHINRSRLLFATHFHVLADMTKHFDHLGCYCTDVMEHDSGTFSYVHRLRRGVNRESHALKVARLAGLPEAAITVAKNVLETLRLQDTTQLHHTGEAAVSPL